MKEDYAVFFIGIILLSMAVYLILGLCTGGQGFLRIFFRECTDAFMDFFNSIRDVTAGGDTYTERGVIYPPMANLFFLAMSLLVPNAYKDTSFDDRYEWVEYPICWVLIGIFVAISLILFALIIFAGAKQFGKKRGWMVFVSVFSVPFLNMLERGNIVTFSFLGLMAFAVTYNSEKPWIRELGVLALAFSFSIKLYPILFAWILFANKRYGAFFRCALYSLAFLILPSFFFGGPICLWWILQNILSFSGAGAGGVMGVVSAYTHIPVQLLNILLYLPFLLSALCYLISPYVHKEHWKVWALGCITFVAFPALSTTYAWTLFIIPILYLCNEGHHKEWTLKKGNKGYLVTMLIPFLFFAIPMRVIPGLKPVIEKAGPVLSFNAIVVYACIVVLSVFAIVDTVRVCLEQRKHKKTIE